MRKLILCALLAATGLAHAEFSIPGFELVQTAPLETKLSSSDLRDPATVWCELFDGSRSQIVLGEYYAVGHAGSSFDQVMEHLTAAGKPAGSEQPLGRIKRVDEAAADTN